MDKKVLYDFLNDYTKFWEEVLVEEKEKLKNISSGNVELVEKSINDQQAVIMKINNMEDKRIKLLEEVNLKDKTFKEVVMQASEEYKPQLLKNLETFEKTFEDIKYYNDKCKEIAKSHLDYIGANTEKENTYSIENKYKKPIFGKKI